MSKERQRKRKKAAAQKGTLHPTRGYQKTERRPGHSLEETAWVALKRHAIEPVYERHEDDDPERPDPVLLDCVFELGFSWSPDQKASFVAVPVEDVLTECLAPPAPFERDALLAGIDALAAEGLLAVEGEAVRLLVGEDVLERINKGERILD